MSITRMSAQDALALFDAPDVHETTAPVVDPEAPAGFVAYHPEKGVFIGTTPGGPFGVSGTIAVWSGIESFGQTAAVLFETPEIGTEFFAQSGAARPDMFDGIEYFATPSGRWQDLQALGLNVHDMPFNSFSPSLAIH